MHKELGPGLLESAYEACIAYELTQNGLNLERQKGLPLNYRGVHLDCGYRIDLLVETQVVVEVKAVEKIELIHEAQLLSYLKLSKCPVGLLINFNVEVLKNGIRRLVNRFSGEIFSEFSASSGAGFYDIFHRRERRVRRGRPKFKEDS